jgi:hypothetical protein
MYFICKYIEMIFFLIFKIYIQHKQYENIKKIN